MSTFIDKLNTTREVTDFHWRTKDGRLLRPREMDTRHLCSTLRMIWNHSVEEEHKIKPYRHYTFAAFYTAEYMRDAVVAILTELLLRKEWDSEVLYLVSVIQVRMYEGDHANRQIS